MASLDLNLLVSLHALLQERSVTRAAERLGISQPTMSGTLARLRRHYGDELLYRSGNSYDLTPLGLELAERTGLALDGVHRVLAAQTTDPATSTREFVVVTSDYGAAVLGSQVTAAISRRAPSVTTTLRQSDPAPFATDEIRLRSVDGVVMPHGHFRDLPHVDLYRDRWVCVVDAANTRVGDTLSVEDLSRLPWAASARAPRRGSTGVRALTQAGVRMQVQAVVDMFLPLPFLVGGTDRIALVPQRLMAHLHTPHLRVLECPIDAGPLVVALWWHPDFERDAEHAWMRGQVAEAASGLDRVPTSPMPIIGS